MCVLCRSLARRQSTHCTVEGGPHHWSDTPRVWELQSCFLVCRWKKSESESLKLENLDYLQSSSTDPVLNIALTSKILNSLGGSSEEEKKKSLIFSYQIEKQNPPNRFFFFFFAFLSVSMKNEYFNESLKEKIHPEVVIERKHVSLKLQVTKYNQCGAKRWNMQPTRSWKLHYWESCGTYLALHSLLHHINQQPSIHSPRKSSWSNPTRHFHNNGFLYAGSLPEIMGFIKSNSSMILVKNQFTFCISVQ